MKKYLYITTILAFCIGLFSSCEDVNKKFDFEKVPTNIIHENLRMSDADFEKLASLLGADDKDAAAFLKSNHAFSEEFDANKYGATLIKDLYKDADTGSSVNLQYKFVEGRNGLVADLSGNAHQVTTANYKSVWGDMFPESFTPKKSPSRNIPNILKTEFPDAVEGDIKNLSYYFSKEEPVDVTVVGETVIDEDFQTIETGTGKVINLPGWLSADLKGTFNWEGRAFTTAEVENRFANATSYKSGGENDIWLIAPKQTVLDKSDMQLSFDVNVRNYTAECLSVLISEDFDGTKANILAANWKNVSLEFNIPAANMTEMANVGNYALGDYKGESVYVAFRYQGDATAGISPLKTTTYQVDNFKIYEGVPGIDVKEKALEYGQYQFDGTVWKEFKDATVVHLQPADYADFGSNYPDMKVNFAQEQAPKYLKLKYPMAREGDSKILSFNTSVKAAYADEYTLEKGEWILNSFVDIREGQFIRTEKDGWVFDPTILVDFGGSKVAYQVVVDYVARNIVSPDNPDLIDRAETELYYGFSAYFINVNYRAEPAYRLKDKTFPSTASVDEQVEFMNKRTMEALGVYLMIVYPDAKPEISGIKQFAEMQNLKFHRDPSSTLTNAVWTYRLQCVGDKEWIVIKRVSVDTGEVQEINEEQ